MIHPRHSSAIISLTLIFLTWIYAPELLAADNTIEPAGSLPTVYITTENNIPIDQKETYIPATAYITTPDGSELTPLGSAENQIKLGIRGRGNSTWTFLAEKKPYKIKFDKKQNPLNLGKNKHFALLNLPYSNRFGFIYSPLAFQIARTLELGWVPSQTMVEVVLNGDYRGWYILSETVRIDSNRVDIEEQSPDNTDPALLPYGWLIEIDNYRDVNQIDLGAHDGSSVAELFTVKSPDPMNSVQQQWATDFLAEVTSTLRNSSPYERDWEKYFDLPNLARYFLLQELTNNEDSFTGSTYFYKTGAKLTMGPVWDIGDDFCWTKKRWNTFEGSRRKVWGKDLARFPRFWKEVNKQFQTWKASFDYNEMDAYIDLLAKNGEAAMHRSSQRFPETAPTISLSRAVELAKALYRLNIDFIESSLDKDYKTCNLSTTVICPENREAGGHVIANGIPLPDVEYFYGDEPSISIEPAEGYSIGSISYNDHDITASYAGNPFKLPAITSDSRLDVEFKKSSGINPMPEDNNKAMQVDLHGNNIDIVSETEIEFYSMTGILIKRLASGKTSTTLPSGVYLIRSGSHTAKLMIN